MLSENPQVLLPGDHISSLSKSVVYADDTTVIIRGNTISEAVQKANLILQQYNIKHFDNS